MIYAIADVVEIDMIAGIGFLLFQPILSIIFTSLTIIICLIIGLPIRRIKTARDFWNANPLISIAGIVIGCFFLLLSFSNKFTEIRKVEIEDSTVHKEVPNMILTVTGWFLIGFNLIHIQPKSLLGFKWKRKLPVDPE